VRAAGAAGKEAIMKRMKGPGIFLAQFLGEQAPFDNLANIARWASGLGYTGVQIPAWDARAFDLDRGASSKTYCDEVRGILAGAGLEAIELGAYLAG
jgi:sugar phosphate isomerase/epimerase